MISGAKEVPLSFYETLPTLKLMSLKFMIISKGILNYLIFFVNTPYGVFESLIVFYDFYY